MIALIRKFIGGLGLKDYIAYAAIAGFAFYSWTLYHDGEKHAKAQQAALVAAANQHNRDLEKIAALSIADIGVKHDEAATRPVTDAPVARLCRAAAPVKVPAAAGGAGAVAANPASPVVGSGDAENLVAGPDIGRPSIALARKDDADLTYLLGIIDILEAEMRKAK